MNPLLVVPCETSAWNDTVDMRMEQHILSPHVQDAEEADVGAKMFGFSRDLHKRLGDSTEQQTVEFDLVFQDKRVQLMREREHDMEIGDREKFPLSCGDPTLTRLSLALCAYRTNENPRLFLRSHYKDSGGTLHK